MVYFGLPLSRRATKGRFGRHTSSFDDAEDFSRDEFAQFDYEHDKYGGTQKVQLDRTKNLVKVCISFVAFLALANRHTSPPTRAVRGDLSRHSHRVGFS